MPKITNSEGKQVTITQEEYNELFAGGRWKPKIGQSYFTVNGEHVASSYYSNDNVSNFRISQRNVFRTKEEAEKHLEYLKALAVIRDDAEDFEPNWSDESNGYEVIVDNAKKELEIATTNYYRRVGNIYFETEEKAQHSIDTHRDEWLTVFGVKEQQ